MPTPLYFVVPAGVDDPRRPSGGNIYDLELMRELRELGWTVHLVRVAGSWPLPSPNDQSELHQALEAIPEDSTVLVDGLVGCAVPDIMTSHSVRHRMVMLVHMPLANDTALDPHAAEALDRAERRALHCMSAVVTTSRFTAASITEHHGLPGVRVHVAAPGVHLGPLAQGSGHGRHLLTVANLAPHKGHATLVRALAELKDMPWNWKLAGAETHPAHADRLRAVISEAGLTDRVTLLGPQSGEDLKATYAWADLAVLPTNTETYCMSVSEALARGLPAYVSDVGGVPEALGHAVFPGSVEPERPGRLLPVGDSAAWAEALGEWMCRPSVRGRLLTLAEQRQRTLSTWRTPALEVHGALQGLSCTPWHAERDMASA